MKTTVLIFSMGLMVGCMKNPIEALDKAADTTQAPLLCPAYAREVLRENMDRCAMECNGDGACFYACLDEVAGE